LTVKIPTPLTIAPPPIVVVPSFRVTEPVGLPEAPDTVTVSLVGDKASPGVTANSVVDTYRMLITAEDELAAKLVSPE
jgi:hypothetical protein